MATCSNGSMWWKTQAEKIHDEYKSTFEDWIRSKGKSAQHELKMQELAKKDVTIGTPSAGGYGVPQEIGRQISLLEQKYSPVRRLVKVVQTGSSDYKELVDINITANWRLIRSMDPLLRLSDAGRALFVTSGAARKHTPFWGGYAMSKAALESIALTYAAECEGTSVKVNLLNPGTIRTAMRAKAMPGEEPSRLKRPEDVAPLIVELLSASNDRNGAIIDFQ